MSVSKNDDIKLTPADKYLEVELLFKELEKVTSHAIASYYIWSTLHFSLSTTEVGRETAESNLEIIKRFNYFFQHTEYVHLHNFILGINKFYDPDKRTSSINTIISKLLQYAPYITAEVIHDTRPDRFDDAALMEMASNYCSKENIRLVNKMRRKHTNLIKKLRDFRHKLIAHNEYGAEFDKTFVPVEVENLINDSQKIFNILQHSAYLATTDWTGMKEGSVRHTKQMLDVLKLGEAERIASIQEQFRKKLSK